jgi:hypothetical protein
MQKNEKPIIRMSLKSLKYLEHKEPAKHFYNLAYIDNSLQ